MSHLLSFLLANPLFYAACVKVAVDAVKKELAKVDSMQEPEKVKNAVHLAVMVCSMVALLGNLYLNHNLNSISTDQINGAVNLLTLWVQTAATAVGLHEAAKLMRKGDGSKTK